MKKDFRILYLKLGGASACLCDITKTKRDSGEPDQYVKYTPAGRIGMSKDLRGHFLPSCIPSVSS